MTDRIVGVVIPDGYENAEAFARDCGVEIFDLKKCPVAFRLKKHPHGAWVYFDDEEQAASAAERHDVEYQGLYVRDGLLDGTTP
jgi:hypothetical protein